MHWQVSRGRGGSASVVIAVSFETTETAGYVPSREVGTPSIYWKSETNFNSFSYLLLSIITATSKSLLCH